MKINFCIFINNRIFIQKNKSLFFKESLVCQELKF